MVRLHCSDKYMILALLGTKKILATTVAVFEPIVNVESSSLSFSGCFSRIEKLELSDDGTD
jgi:hypothetical protein